VVGSLAAIWFDPERLPNIPRPLRIAEAGDEQPAPVQPIAAVESSCVLTKTEAFKLIRSIIQVRTETGGGSGVIIKSAHGLDRMLRTYILTAAHVVHDFKEVQVVDFDYLFKLRVMSTTNYAARVVDVSPALDVALLEVRSEQPLGRETRIATDDDFDDVTLYEPVYAIGGPSLEPPSITDGHLSVLEITRLRFSAPVAGGDSGGGLFLRDGRLIGIVTGCGVQNGPMGTPLVLPHMAIATPSSVIVPWLREIGAGFLLGDKDSSVAGLLAHHSH
jgi:S1-C subfamily serine protease